MRFRQMEVRGRGRGQAEDHNNPCACIRISPEIVLRNCPSCPSCPSPQATFALLHECCDLGIDQTTKTYLTLTLAANAAYYSGVFDGVLYSSHPCLELWSLALSGALGLWQRLRLGQLLLGGRKAVKEDEMDWRGQPKGFDVARGKRKATPGTHVRSPTSQQGSREQGAGQQGRSLA